MGVSPPLGDCFTEKLSLRLGRLCFQLLSVIQLWVIYVVKCSLPGQNPEKDDALVCCGLSKGFCWRRGLVVSLRGTVFILKSDVELFTSRPDLRMFTLTAL